MTNDELLAGLLQSQLRRKGGGCSGVIYVVLALAMIVAFAVLTADRLGYVPPSVMGPYVGTPQTVLRTQPTGAPKQQPPSLPIGGGGGAPAWPTLTPQPQETEAPTLTIPPAPTAAPSFWTEEELAQMTATAEAFYTVIPTAPPEFATYVDERCKDPEVVAQSKLLQAFCRK